MELVVEDSCVINSKLYFIIRGMRLLFDFDTETQEINVVDVLPVGEPFDINDGIKMFGKKNKIIFTPMGTKCIWIYNIIVNKWHSIDLPLVCDRSIDMQLFVSVMYNEKLVMIGCHLPYIICVDVNTNRVDYVDLMDCMNKKTIPYFDRFRFCMEKNCFTIPRLNSDEEINVLIMEDNVEWQINRINKYENNAKGGFGNFVVDGRKICVRNDYTLIILNDGGFELEIGLEKICLDKLLVKKTIMKYIIEKNIKFPKLISESYGIDFADFIQVLNRN